MSASAEDWEFIIDLEKGDEDSPAQHPLARCLSFDDTRVYLEELEMQYKGKYDELRLQYYMRGLGYGARSESWTLEGRYTDETKRLLYGKSK